MFSRRSIYRDKITNPVSPNRNHEHYWLIIDYWLITVIIEVHKRDRYLTTQFRYSPHVSDGTWTDTETGRRVVCCWNLPLLLKPTFVETFCHIKLGSSGTYGCRGQEKSVMGDTMTNEGQGREFEYGVPTWKTVGKGVWEVIESEQTWFNGIEEMDEQNSFWSERGFPLPAVGVRPMTWILSRNFSTVVRTGKGVH